MKLAASTRRSKPAQIGGQPSRILVPSKAGSFIDFALLQRPRSPPVLGLQWGHARLAFRAAIATRPDRPRLAVPDVL